MLLASHSAVAAMGPFEIYEQALRNDPVFLGAIKERDAGLENRIIGRAGLLPRLSYNYNKGRNDSTVTYLGDAGRSSEDRRYDSYGSTFSLQQPLFDYGAYASYRKGVAQALYAELAASVLPGQRFDDPALACEAFIGFMTALVQRMPFAQRLAEVGVSEADLDRLSDDAMKVERLLINNPRPVSREDARAIYASVL